LTALDSKQYKEAERQSWNSVAPAWQKWWGKTIERDSSHYQQLKKLYQTVKKQV